MGRAPCCEKVGLKKGRWTAEEDQILTSYIQTHGEGSWRSLPKNAGLLRCGKSCRLRWINYLRTDVRRGNITTQEEELIVRLHQTLGNRWSVIAGHLPGRTDNEIKNYWNSHLSRKIYHFRRPCKARVVAVGGQEPATTVISDDVATVPKRRDRIHREAMKKHKLLLLTSLSNSEKKTPEITATGSRIPADNMAAVGLQVLADGSHGSGAGQEVQEGGLQGDMLEGPLDEWLKSQLLELDCLLQSEGEVSTTEKEVSMDYEWFDWDHWG